MRISDWSSDVCSSDLTWRPPPLARARAGPARNPHTRASLRSAPRTQRREESLAPPARSGTITAPDDDAGRPTAVTHGQCPLERAACAVPRLSGPPRLHLAPDHLSGAQDVLEEIGRAHVLTTFTNV